MEGSASKMANGMARSVTGAPSGFFEMTNRQDKPKVKCYVWIITNTFTSWPPFTNGNPESALSRDHDAHGGLKKVCTKWIYDSSTAIISDKSNL